MKRPRRVSEVDATSEMVETLVAFAKEHDVCILMAHHINREPDRSTTSQHGTKSVILRRYSFSDVGLTSAFAVSSFGVLYLMNPWATEPPGLRRHLHIAKGLLWPQNMAILGAMKIKNAKRFEIPLEWAPSHAMFSTWHGDNAGLEDYYPTTEPLPRPHDEPADPDEEDELPF